MIKQDEFQALMLLSRLAGQDQMDASVEAINAISEASPGSLPLWLDICRQIASRADAAGFERGKATAAPATAPAATEKGGPFPGYSEHESETIRTWRADGSRGTRVPGAVERYIQENCGVGKPRNATWAATKFNISPSTVYRIIGEASEERVAVIEAKTNSLAMPPEFLES